MRRGAISDSRTPWCPFAALAAAIGVSAAAAPAPVPSDSPASYVTISVLRWADVWDSPPYRTVVRLWIADESAQRIDIKIVQPDLAHSTLYGGVSRRGPHEWEWQDQDRTWADLRPWLTATWTFEVYGPAPSVTEFTLDAAGLPATALYEPPDIIAPIASATDVPSTVQFVWANPAAPSAPDHLSLYEWGANGCGPAIVHQLASDEGQIAASATTWQPSIAIGAGWNEFGLTYTRDLADGEASVGPLTVVSGSIRWGNPPGAPRGYPPATPLLRTGSHRQISFQVPPPPTVVGDLNGDGVVNGADLGILLANWAG